MSDNDKQEVEKLQSKYNMLEHENLRLIVVIAENDDVVTEKLRVIENDNKVLRKSNTTLAKWFDKGASLSAIEMQDNCKILADDNKRLRAEVAECYLVIDKQLAKLALSAGVDRVNRNLITEVEELRRLNSSMYNRLYAHEDAPFTGKSDAIKSVMAKEWLDQLHDNMRILKYLPDPSKWVAPRSWKFLSTLLKGQEKGKEKKHDKDKEQEHGTNDKDGEIGGVHKDSAGTRHKFDPINHGTDGVVCNFPSPKDD